MIEANLNQRLRRASHTWTADRITFRRSDNGEVFLISVTTTGFFLILTSVAQARSAYDGPADLLFVT